MEFKATDIAKFLNGKIEGNADVTVHGISKIEEGKKGTLSFLANEKYEKFIYNTESSIVLVNKSFVPKEKINTTLIKVEDAYQAFAALLKLYEQSIIEQKIGIETPSYIDSSVKKGEDIYVGAFAYIGKNVTLGNNVKIYPQAYIGDNTTIDDNSIIYSGVKIYPDVIIGKNCVIHSGAVIGSDGFGFAVQEDGTYDKIPQLGNVILEDNVDIGANTTIDCGTMGSTSIRKGAKVDNLVQIAHNCDIGENSVIAGQVGFAGTTKLGKNCRIAGQVGFAGHLNIGDNVQIGAQSGVSNSIKDNAIVFSTPAFDKKAAAKSAVIYRNLPKLRETIIRLEKEVNQLKNKEQK